MRGAGRREAPVFVRHRRRIEPPEGLVVELRVLLDKVLQHLPLSPIFKSCGDNKES
jgi:hypothetical protein